MITYDLYEAVKTALSSCTRAQTLTLAALGLERLWPMFCAWTETEGDPLLYQKPSAIRQPARELLDRFWELAEGGRAEARLDRQLHHFWDFVLVKGTPVSLERFRCRRLEIWRMDFLP